MQDSINDTDLFTDIDYVSDQHKRHERLVSEIVNNPNIGQQARDLPERYRCFTEQELKSCLRELLLKVDL